MPHRLLMVQESMRTLHYAVQICPAWWEARIKLITAQTPLATSTADVTLELQHLRTRVRLALVQRIMNLSRAESELHVQQMLQ